MFPHVPAVLWEIPYARSLVSSDDVVLEASPRRVPQEALRFCFCFCLFGSGGFACGRHNQGLAASDVLIARVITGYHHHYCYCCEYLSMRIVILVVVAVAGQCSALCLHASMIFNGSRPCCVFSHYYCWHAHEHHTFDTLSNTARRASGRRARYQSLKRRRVQANDVRKR